MARYGFEDGEMIGRAGRTFPFAYTNLCMPLSLHIHIQQQQENNVVRELREAHR